MNVSELHKIAEGREAEIFEWEGGTVLRLMRSNCGLESVELQARALRAAHDAGVTVPIPGDTTIVEGRHGLVMERIDGPDLLTLLGNKPWHIWSAGKTTGRLQASLHEVVAPEGLPNLKASLQQGIESSDRVPAAEAKLALEMLADLPDGDRLCHGDFHPGNIIQAKDRDVVIDWSNVVVGDPAADLARSRLLIRMGEPPPGAPFLVRTLAVVGRGALGVAIRRGYRQQRAVDEDLVRRWEVPVMAHRLTEYIEEERPKLLKLLKERLREHS
ncbi:MAG: phosphotransferase [Chloroflexi bacterium]|nr:phosphotransferase [Chloroflexota bacterium]